MTMTYLYMETQTAMTTVIKWKNKLGKDLMIYIDPTFFIIDAQPHELKWTEELFNLCATVLHSFDLFYFT